MRTSLLPTAVTTATFLLIIAGCGTTDMPFAQYGAMRQVMRDGMTEGRVALSDVATGPNVFAVGALAGLAGEVTVTQGNVWVTRTVDGKAVTTGPFVNRGDSATLLSVATTNRFKSRVVDTPLDQDQLEEAVGQMVGGHAPTTKERPSLFLINGIASKLDAHVIAGECPTANPASPALKFQIKHPVAVQLIGFFADNAEGVITHHGTRVHLHVIFENDGAVMTAHVDSVSLLAGSKLTVSDAESPN